MLAYFQFKLSGVGCIDKDTYFTEFVENIKILPGYVEFLLVQPDLLTCPLCSTFWTKDIFYKMPVSYLSKYHIKYISNVDLYNYSTLLVRHKQPKESLCIMNQTYDVNKQTSVQ